MPLVIFSACGMTSDGVRLSAEPSQETERQRQRDRDRETERQRQRDRETETETENRQTDIQDVNTHYSLFLSEYECVRVCA